jgi:signal-transduction protein with cAMP-binding, CBS, and nucleotidyltransferase domain
VFIHGGESTADRETYTLLALQVMVIVNECLPIHQGIYRGGNTFWHGSFDDWQQFLADSVIPHPAQAETGHEGTAGDERYARAVTLAADLRPVCGNSDLAARTVAAGWTFLSTERGTERFRQLARTVATMPVALGIFGRFRTARTGRHRGEFCLDDMAIRPLVASVRLMAVASEIDETGTVERIRALLATGNLGVALADRLLLALHDFVRCRIDRELAGEPDGGDYFFNPDTLGDSERERFKTGLEDLTTLQRLVYQQLVEVA